MASPRPPAKRSDSVWPLRSRMKRMSERSMPAWRMSPAVCMYGAVPPAPGARTSLPFRSASWKSGCGSRVTMAFGFRALSWAKATKSWPRPWYIAGTQRPPRTACALPSARLRSTLGPVVGGIAAELEPFVCEVAVLDRDVLGQVVGPVGRCGDVIAGHGCQVSSAICSHFVYEMLCAGTWGGLVNPGSSADSPGRPRALSWRRARAAAGSPSGAWGDGRTPPSTARRELSLAACSPCPPPSFKRCAPRSSRASSRSEIGSRRTSSRPGSGCPGFPSGRLCSSWRAKASSSSRSSREPRCPTAPKTT